MNGADSIGKNWQNMINDIATEATTIHSRFPHAVVAFLVIVPFPVLGESQQDSMIETLERLARRNDVTDSVYMAEAIALVLWHPTTGAINTDVPFNPRTEEGKSRRSPLRIELFSERIHDVYADRYKGLPPHTAALTPDERAHDRGKRFAQQRKFRNMGEQEFINSMSDRLLKEGFHYDIATYTSAQLWSEMKQ